MRKADLIKNHISFDKSLDRYRTFTERILSARRVIRGQLEKRDLVESLILRICANWERFVDEHLIDCVNVNDSKLSVFLGVSIPRNPSRNLCEALLFSGRYLDFRSFGDLKGFSKGILPDSSNPFLTVKERNSRYINQAFKLRNYLAHYSAASRRSLDKMYKQHYKLKRFIEPGQFLTAYNGRRLWTILDGFKDASSDMKVWY